MSTDQLTALSMTESVDWKCRACAGSAKPKRISVIIPEPEDDESEVDNPSTLVLSEKERLGIVRELRQIVREIVRDELQSTLNFYSKKIDDYEEQIKEYDTRVKLLENQQKDLHNKYKNIILKSDVLEQKVGQIEQSRTSNDIEICGVMEVEQENLSTIVQKIGQLLNQKTEDIISVRRKTKPMRPGSAQAERAKVTAPIIVTLQPGCRDSWLSSSKTAKLNARSLDMDSDDIIYLRESLSPSTSYLLWKAKNDLKKTSLCEYVWYKNGMIMARIKEGDKKIFYIRSTRDIEKIAQGTKDRKK